MTYREIEPQKPNNEQESSLDTRQQNDMAFFTQLKSIQNLVTIATIAGPASLLIGGVLLGIIAVICGAIALNKLKKLSVADHAQAELIGKVKKSAIIAIGISVAAIVVNGIFVAIMMPEVMAALESGDLNALQGGSSTSASSSSSSSVWG